MTTARIRNILSVVLFTCLIIALCMVATGRSHAQKKDKTKTPAAPTMSAPGRVGAPIACPAGALHCASLTWVASVVDANHSAPTGYNVYRSATSGGCSTINPLPIGCTKVASNVTLTTYIDSPLQATTTYNYVVTAFNTSGTGTLQESVPSNQWTGTTPADPINPPNTPTTLSGQTQ